MAKEDMTIRMEPELKEQVATLLKTTGPFDVESDEPNETTYATIEAANQDEDMYGPFDTVSEMMEALND